MNTHKPTIWTTGDWNAFFGYGSNLLVNVLTLTGLLKFVIGMPNDLIFNQVLPAVGVMLFVSAAYYSYLAYKLAQSTGRRDVCALPSGPGVGHMFIVTLVIMLPIKLKTGDVMKAWEAGMAWIFIQSVVIMIGGFAGEWIRRVTPRAALLAALAGISFTYIAIRPMSLMYATPVIGLLCFMLIILSWFGRVRFFKGIPAGLLVIIVGAAIAWSSNLVGLNYGGLSVGGVIDSFSNFGFKVPIPVVGHVFSGFEFIGILLVTAVPFGIYDIVEAIDNVESAHGAGDSYPTKRVLIADGVISMMGCMLGNPFMLVVYIGHPGWKAMGGRIGYCFASGSMILVLCCLSIVSVMLAIIPIVAVLPILIFIAMLIGSQAFRETPARHAPAVVLGIIPHIAHWGAGMVKSTLQASGVTDITDEVTAKLADNGILLHAMEILGDGAVLSGIVMAAATVLIIERQLKYAAIFTFLGAVMTWFGLMHSPELSFGASPTLAVSYLLVTVMILACDKFSVFETELEDARSPDEKVSAELIPDDLPNQPAKS